ncbi:hypothetical protein ACWGS9_32495 [Bradyrhizobium sp. Arg314]
MSNISHSVERADVDTRITVEIVAAIEAGAGEFVMPWHHDGTATARPIAGAANPDAWPVEHAKRTILVNAGARGTLLKLPEDLSDDEIDKLLSDVRSRQRSSRKGDDEDRSYVYSAEMGTPDRQCYRRKPPVAPTAPNLVEPGDTATSYRTGGTVIPIEERSIGRRKPLTLAATRPTRPHAKTPPPRKLDPQIQGSGLPQSLCGPCTGDEHAQDTGAGKSPVNFLSVIAAHDFRASHGLMGAIFTDPF